MKNFKTMTTPKKKMLAGATAVVALSGFVPAINAASPTATANVGVSVVIQQAVTISVTANVDFGTLILSAATVVGTYRLHADSQSVVLSNFTDELSHLGGNNLGKMIINSSAGAVNIALGAAPTDATGAIQYLALYLKGSALAAEVALDQNDNKNISLVGGTIDIGGKLKILFKPTPGTYNTKSFAITVTDI